MLAGAPYVAFAPELLAARARRLLHCRNVTEYVVGDAARATLTELLPHAGRNVWGEPPAVGPGQLEPGCLGFLQ